MSRSIGLDGITPITGACCAMLADETGHPMGEIAERLR